MPFINIGDRLIPHAVDSSKVCGVYSLKGVGVARAKKAYDKRGDLIDLRYGAKARSLIVLDNRTALLSPHSVKLLLERMNLNPIGIVSVGQRVIPRTAKNNHHLTSMGATNGTG